MAIFTGTSVRGIQRLGAFTITPGLWQVRLNSTPAQEKLDRKGTIVVYRTRTTNRYLAIAVYKFYGFGIAPEPLNLTDMTGIEVWANWFEEGLLWFFERPD